MLRFSCEKALLQSAVNTVSRAVAAKSSIPALEGILVEGSDRLTMSGYNMQTGIRTAFEAEIHEEGRIVLNARLNGEINRKLCGGYGVCGYDRDMQRARCFCNDGHYGTACEKDGTGRSELSSSSYILLCVCGFLFIVEIGV